MGRGFADREDEVPHLCWQRKAEATEVPNEEVLGFRKVVRLRNRGGS